MRVHTGSKLHAHKVNITPAHLPWCTHSHDSHTSAWGLINSLVSYKLHSQETLTTLTYLTSQGRRTKEIDDKVTHIMTDDDMRTNDEPSQQSPFVTTMTAHHDRPPQMDNDDDDDTDSPLLPHQPSLNLPITSPQLHPPATTTLRRRRTTTNKTTQKGNAY